MTPTAWADLPNAKHIDRILDDLKKNPDRWSATRNAAMNDEWADARDAARVTAWYASWYAARSAAWNAAWNAARDDARDDAWDAVSEDARTAASDAAYGAISALIAYDDCAYLLDEKPEHVQMLGLLGNQQALLLYPACIVLQKEMA